MSKVSDTELYTLKWLISYYVNFHLNFKKEKQKAKNNSLGQMPHPYLSIV